MCAHWARRLFLFVLLCRRVVPPVAAVHFLLANRHVIDCTAIGDESAVVGPACLCVPAGLAAVAASVVLSATCEYAHAAHAHRHTRQAARMRRWYERRQFGARAGR